MSKKVRKPKNELQLEKDNVEEEDQSTRVESKSVKLVLSFDMYFQLLRQRDPNVLIHHKAPMRKFAEAQKTENGTVDEFDKIFKKY